MKHCGPELMTFGRLVKEDGWIDDWVLGNTLVHGDPSLGWQMLRKTVRDPGREGSTLAAGLKSPILGLNAWSAWVGTPWLPVILRPSSYQREGGTVRM